MGSVTGVGFVLVCVPAESFSLKMVSPSSKKSTKDVRFVNSGVVTASFLVLKTL